jgi:DNA-binding CsgD family transcriptional regulator
LSIEKRALPLIARIYEAATDPSRWQTFVTELAAAYGGVATGFAFQMPGFPMPGAFFQHGMGTGDPAFLDLFVQYYHRRGLPWGSGYVNQFVGRFGLASEVIPDADIPGTDYYSEWMKPLGLAACGPMCHTVNIEDGKPATVIAMFRYEGQRPWRASDCALGDLLVPHIARAFELHRRFSENSGMAEALDRLPTGVMLLDPRGRVVLRNRSAQRILDLADGLMLDDGVPRAVRGPDNAVLQQMIRSVVDASASPGSSYDTHVMAVSRPSGRRAFPLRLGSMLSASPEHTLHDAVAVLYVSDVEAQTLQQSEPLRKLYALTQAEVELVELLCDGWSLEEASAQRGVTMNTARSQLKQIFFKTGTSRQSELVRLVLAGIAPIRDPRPEVRDGAPDTAGGKG